MSTDENDDKTEPELREEARKVLLREIMERAKKDDTSRALRYAEAYAWLTSPNQPHGGQGGS